MSNISLKTQTTDHTQLNFHLGEWWVEPSFHRISNGENVKHVEPKLMTVLLALVNAGGNCVSREELLNVAWGNVVVGDEVITRAISELRSLLNDTAKDSQYIRTLPKRGYCLTCTPVLEKSWPETTDTTAESVSKPDTYLPNAVLIAAVLFCVAAAFAVFFLNLDKTDTATAQLPTEISVTQETSNLDNGIQTIAVLPFISLSNAPQHELFVDGVSEDIRNTLFGIEGIQVVARTSSELFKGQSHDVKTIGEMLDAQWVMEGSVRIHNQQVRLTAQLIEATTRLPVWSHRYDKELADVFKIQQEIAQDVAAQLKRQFAGEQTQTVSAIAYEKYLMARHNWQLREEDTLRIAETLLKEAIAIEPEYALAHSALADTYVFLNLYGSLDSKTSETLAFKHANKALEINPQLAEAHASVGLIHEHHKRLEQARTAFENALRIKPGYTMANMWLGNTLMMLGQLQEAKTRYQQALETDPLHPIVQSNYLSVLTESGRYKEAFELGQQFYARSGEGAILKRNLHTLTQQGRFELFYKYCEQETQQNPLLAYCLEDTLNDNNSSGLRYLMTESLYMLGLNSIAAQCKISEEQNQSLALFKAMATRDSEQLMGYQAQTIEGFNMKSHLCEKPEFAPQALESFSRAIAHYINADYSTSRSYIEQAIAMESQCWEGYASELSLILYGAELAKLNGDTQQQQHYINQAKSVIEEANNLGWNDSRLLQASFAIAIIEEDEPAIIEWIQRFDAMDVFPYPEMLLEPPLYRYLKNSSLSPLFKEWQQRYELMRKQYSDRVKTLS